MAIGDDAALAGMALVPGTLPANQLDTEANQTRDYLAQGKVKDNTLLPAKIAGTVPIAKGGTGAADAAAARAALAVVAQAGGTIRIRWDGGTLNFVPSINGADTSPLLRFDLGDARYVMKSALARPIPGDITARLEALEAKVAALEAGGS